MLCVQFPHSKISATAIATTIAATTNSAANNNNNGNIKIIDYSNKSSISKALQEN
jgi:hypothetical protein